LTARERWVMRRGGILAMAGEVMAVPSHERRLAHARPFRPMWAMRGGGAFFMMHGASTGFFHPLTEW